MDWWDVGLKAALTLVGSGVTIKWGFDLRKKKNGHTPVTHQELASHALGCAGDIHDRITLNHNEVLSRFGNVQETLGRLDERSKK